MFNKPNSVPVPDELFDTFLKEITPAETKVILAIIRKTYGYHKIWDCISKSQLIEMTNLSPQGISDCISNLIKKEYIISQYVCTCGILIPTYNSKTFQCKKCQTKEPPDKYYTLNTGEDFVEYLKDTLHIVNKRISKHKVIDKNEKGSQLSIQQVGNSVDKEVGNSVDRQETISRNKIQETSFSLISHKVPHFRDNEIQMNDDFLNLSEEEKELLERLENYLNTKCLSKWHTEIHCKKYPNKKYRINIVKCCFGKTTFKFIQDTIDGKLIEVEKESVFDEFLYKSIIHSLNIGVDYYGN